LSFSWLLVGLGGGLGKQGLVAEGGKQEQDGTFHDGIFLAMAKYDM
jgi:hypothetical protein